MQRLASFSRASTPTMAASPDGQEPATAETTTARDTAAELAELENMTLPFELAQSIQAFLVNLTNPVHKAPFGPERLSRMFQDFYAGTFDLVQDLLPETVMSPVGGGELQTTEQIAEGRRRRALIEAKRLAFTEEIEERVCIEMYDRIFELRTSDDEARDEALMSKIIAMNLLGVTLGQLGVDLPDEELAALTETIDKVGEELQSLNNALTPKAKLDIIVACHKSIVEEVQHAQQTKETLEVEESAVPSDQSPPKEAIDDSTAETKTTDEESKPDSSIMPPPAHPPTKRLTRSKLGADAILPIFIYAIIKSNPAKLVSHYTFITRFRASSCLSGESSYCLTNLEAAITFLETFDDGESRRHSDADPLGANQRARDSTSSLAASLRGDRARAISNAAQEVYDLADEQMKNLGAQLSSLVSRVNGNANPDDVRSLMRSSSSADLAAKEQRERFTEVEQRVKARKAADGSKSLSSADGRAQVPQSQPQQQQQQQASSGHGGGGSLGRLAQLGMIRSLSNSWSSNRSHSVSEGLPTRATPARELQRIDSAASSSSATGKDTAKQQPPALPRRPSVEDRFLHMEADSLTLADVRVLLAEYKRLARHIQR